MARTKRDTRHLKCAMITVEEELDLHRSDSNRNHIKRKMIKLLRKNKLSIKGKLNTLHNRLMRFYEKNEDKLPTMVELCDHDTSIYSSNKQIIFVLDDFNNLIEA
jgi:hypothetical protein